VHLAQKIKRAEPWDAKSIMGEGMDMIILFSHNNKTYYEVDSIFQKKIYESSMKDWGITTTKGLSEEEAEGRVMKRPKRARYSIGK